LQHIIQNEEHYAQVIEKFRLAKKRLWIGTADIKDLHVKSPGAAVSFLSLLNKLVQHRVDIRILHAKKPGVNFRRSYAKYPLLEKCIEMGLCPRVHLKMVIIDSSFAYFGSANLTGAGLGMKSENTRNFETGLITDNPAVIADLEKQFDAIWMGKHCPSCGRKAYCKVPLINSF
jgi:phosphatidylserine/phosphatidylglycerophosphate/cardiolipin synthase-like enzyme